LYASGAELGDTNYQLGQLYLTDRRLVFRPNKSLRPSLSLATELDISLRAITSVERDDSYRPFMEFGRTAKLKVQTLKHHRYYFHINTVDEWVQLISRELDRLRPREDGQ